MKTSTFMFFNNMYMNSIKQIRKTGVILLAGLIMIIIGYEESASQNTDRGDTIVVQHLSNANEMINESSLVTMEVSNLTLSTALEMLAKKAKVGISYSSEIIPDVKVDLNLRDVPVHVALYEILEGTDLEPVLPPTKDVIIIREKEQNFKEEVVFQETISGQITDSQTGEPLPGVNIVVAGTTTGTTTDSEGNFELTVQDLQETLIVSYIGYETQNIAIVGRTEIEIELEPTIIAGEELVVVGYGQMRNVNITGSISNVNVNDLENRSVTQTSLALQGKLSGVQVRQLSGNPNDNSASITIRGEGTFSRAGTSPLVLVDGIESSIDNVDPNDVESVSMLKDAASAAIYGSKAANGVILIETKQGRIGAPQFSYNAYVGHQTPTLIPEMVNSWEYAEIANEALRNQGGTNRYTEEEIQKFKSGTDPDNYPNFDHIDYLFGSGNGLETKHNISMRGGNPATQYMVSTNYYEQHGLIKKNKADRYNIRANLSTELKDNLNFDLRLSGVKSYGTEPINPYGSGLAGIVRGAMRLPNAIHGFTPDGYYGRNETLHPEADLNSDSFSENTSSYFYGNANIDWDILDNLTLSGRAGYTLNNLEQRSFVATYDITPTYGISLNSLNESWRKNDELTLLSTIRYVESLKNHNISLLGGVESKDSNFESLSAYRDQFPNNQVTQIDAGATARGRQGGTASRNTLASLFGRANYDFSDKYLFEVNVRYDGSSRFAEGNRWGLFPSVSVGWRLSQENFFQDAIGWIDELKIRASWGEMGNQSIGNYPYQDLIALGQDYPFGSQLSAGAAVTTVANKEITWETTEVTNVGLDFALFNNRINFTADYFIKKTKDILYNVSVSRLLGASPSATNAGAVENKGFDFDISYRNSVGDFTYGASALLSIVHNEVVKLANVDRDISGGLFIGQPIGSRYGYVSDGLFANEEEVNNAPDQPFSFLAKPGGIRYVDISGPNGEPDGRVTAEFDRKVIGNPRPTSTYALNLNGSYKNIDVSVMLQGEGGRNDMVSIPHFFPLANDGNVQRYVYDNRWRPDDPDPNAEYPRVTFLNAGFFRSSTNAVDFWFKDATFIRLKNAQIGYTLPTNLLNKIALERVRLYVTGENLFTLSNYYPGWDPEMQAAGTGFYPLTRKFVFGIDIDF
ncbi:MAG: SusC/RagA family TonB-linked outer membrane protein [Cyclobacteriaceae bacterium]